MKVTPTDLPEVLLLDLDVFTDERGHFFERYHEGRFEKLGLPTHFPQDNHSRSRKNVVRGLHYQLRRPQGKLIWCSRGSVFDVAVDIRVGSPHFGKWTGVVLSEDVPQLMWIPPGFAHGFCALSDVSEVEYKCTDVYVAADERGVLWCDSDLCITWPVSNPVLSERDRRLPTLRAAEKELPQYSASAALTTR